MEPHWTPARVEQAFGQTYGHLADAHLITGYRLLEVGTIDEDISALLFEKKSVVSSGLDGSAVRNGTGHAVAGDIRAALACRGLKAG